MYADVLIEYPVKTLDKTFTYKVPSSINNLKIGHKVVVPFASNIINGIVLNIHNIIPEYETKEIIRIENPNIILNKEALELGKFIQEKTLCNLITAYQTMLPSALKIQDQKHNYDLYDTYVKLNDTEDIEKYIFENKNAHKQIEIINLLKNGKVLKKDLSLSSVKSLISKNIVIEEKIKKNRINYNGILEEDKCLNDDQKIAYESVVNNLNTSTTFLLEGVTGSGKTEVYMQIIKKVLSMGKTAIVLVPEICLTTQAVERFYKRFGKDVAVFHSGLSNGEKYDEYLKIYEGKVKIVVGTRSSIFVPLQNIGIIIIDEEHSDTYKQESNPRYDAKEIASFRCKYHNCPLVLASATPSLESKARSMKGVYKHLTLKNRVNGLSLPDVELINMKDEIKSGNSIFSSKLIQELTKTFANKEQAILLLNRRGYSTFISCFSCGYTYKCPNCDITLTYHKTTNNLRCHLCGYAIKKDDKCPECGEEGLNYLGLGTEKLEAELKKKFPSLKVVRMDQDTTSKKGSYQKILDDFGNGKYDCLLGTQMISKGLDFSNVTLVGIINADTSLNIPDIRSNERTFSLLYQTSGRSGRGKKGKVIIQTFNPDNKVLNFVKENDFENFYKYEMDIRHKLFYPPYSYIVLITVRAKDYEIASKNVNEIKNILKRSVDSETIILGPTPARVFKVNNIYNFNITIKYTYDKSLKNVLKKIDAEYNSKYLTVDITFDPIHF